MARPRAADDFTAIRARMEELRRERERGHSAGGDPRVGRGATARLPSEELCTGPEGGRRSALGKRLDRDRPWWVRPE